MVTKPMLMLVNYTYATCTLNQQMYNFDSAYTQLYCMCGTTLFMSVDL